MKPCIRAVLAAALALPLLAAAQGYPAKPVKMVVPYPPGGGTDRLARIVVDRMSEQLGQRVVVENVAGAGGTLGTASAARAAPDGYTIMMGTLATHSIAPALYSKLQYDASKDFAPIANVAYLTNYVAVGPSVTYKDVAELIKAAKVNPGKITFASAGNGTASHLAVELFRLRTGVNVVHVPYKGGAPAFSDLIGGHVDAIFGDPVGVLAQAKAGKLRALAFAGPSRSAAMPEVPTTAEAGLPDFHVRVWHGVLAPAGVPDEVAKRLSEAITASLKHADVLQALARSGAEPGNETLTVFGKLIESERQKWTDVVRRASVKID